MEGQTILEILLICLLVGYGAGITTAFMVMNPGRSYAHSPVVVESADSSGAGCAWLVLALFGMGALVLIALVLAPGR